MYSAVNFCNFRYPTLLGWRCFWEVHVDIVKSVMNVLIKSIVHLHEERRVTSTRNLLGSCRSSYVDVY